MPANLYESVCVPDLGEFLGYQPGSSGGSNSTSGSTTDGKSTPVGNNASAAAPVVPAGQSPMSVPSPVAAVPMPQRQYHSDGKFYIYSFYLIADCGRGKKNLIFTDKEFNFAPTTLRSPARSDCNNANERCTRGGALLRGASGPSIVDSNLFPNSLLRLEARELR